MQHIVIEADVGIKTGYFERYSFTSFVYEAAREVG